MICPFCNQHIPSAVAIESAFSPVMNGICRIHRPFIIGVMNEPYNSHYGYWIAANGIEIIINIGEETTLVNKFKSVYECCGKKYALKKYPLFYREGWCYAPPFYDERLYTIHHMMDLSPDSFNDILKRMERLKAFS